VRLARVIGVCLVTILACFCASGDISRHKSTMERLRTIADALASYRDAQGAYPVSREVELTMLEPELRRFADGPLPTTDAWGRPLRFMSTGSSYVLWSLGRDGLSDSAPAGGPQVDVDADIVMFNGSFWQQLEGLGPLRPPSTENPFLLIRQFFDDRETNDAS